MPYVVLEKLHQLYDGYRKPLRVAGLDLLLLQESGQVYLLHNRCPHLGSPLTHASCSDESLRCPLHGMEFNLRTGKAISTADCSMALQFFPLIYEGNTCGIDLAN
jgi:nitrite reductase/ring-hydroxylating ferredoxin subunit